MLDPKGNNSEVPTEIISAQQILKLKLSFEIYGAGQRLKYLKKQILILEYSLSGDPKRWRADEDSILKYPSASHS